MKAAVQGFRVPLGGRMALKEDPQEREFGIEATGPTDKKALFLSPRGSVSFPAG